jgi:hypothetical protein
MFEIESLRRLSRSSSRLGAQLEPGDRIGSRSSHRAGRVARDTPESRRLTAAVIAANVRR